MLLDVTDLNFFPDMMVFFTISLKFLVFQAIFAPFELCHSLTSHPSNPSPSPLLQFTFARLVSQRRT